jgi:hypothetical protein
MTRKNATSQKKPPFPGEKVMPPQRKAAPTGRKKKRRKTMLSKTSKAPPEDFREVAAKNNLSPSVSAAALVKQIRTVNTMSPDGKEEHTPCLEEIRSALLGKIEKVQGGDMGAARSYATTCIGGSVTLAQRVDRSGGAGQGELMNFGRISGRRKVLPPVCRSLMIALAVVAVAASPCLVVAGESASDMAAGGDHEAAKEHGESDHHKNHVALLAGFTEAEEHHGEQGAPDFTIGIDYERRLSKVFGIGVLADWVIEDNREYMVGIPIFLHAGRHAKFELAPAVRHLTHSGENQFVFRTGFLWDFHVGKISIAPAVFYDFSEGQDFFAFGLGFGKGF